MMRPLLTLSVCSFALIFTGFSDISAQTTRPAAIKGPNIIAPAGEAPIYQIEMNKGRLINLKGIASSVIVADPTIADVQVLSPRSVYVNAKKVGETSLLAVGNNDNEILNATIEVTHNISKLNRAVRDIAPNADVQFRSVDGGIVMEGFVDTPQESERVSNLASGFITKETRVINMVNTAGTDQVMLQVKIAEVARNELERFGISVSQLFNSGNFVFRTLQGRAFGSVAGTITRNGADNTIGFGYDGGRHDANGVIDALQRDGLVSILAEPSLTTTSGKPANFLAGGEFPVPVIDADGRINIEYKQFGIGLEFTPTVLSEDKISLQVKPEVSNISATNSISVNSTTTYNVPTLQTRRANTTVELGSGQSFVVAGLFKNDRNNTVDKFPGLGDLPVLGTLFRSNEFRNDQTELVILVTPILVKPTDNKNPLQLPTDGFYPPTDIERLFLGESYQMQTGDAPAPAQQLHGDAGFILE